MTNSKKARIAIGLGAALMLFTQNVHAESLKELEQKKSQLQNQVSDSSEKKAQLETELKQVEQDIATLEAKLREIYSKIQETDKKIQEKILSIEKTKEEIEEIKVVIKETELDLEKKKAKIKQNLQMMSSRGEVQFLELMFRSDSWSQFVFRFDTYMKMMNKGEELHAEVLEKLNYIKQQKQLSEDKKELLTNEKASLESEKQQQEVQKAEQKRLQGELVEKKKHVEGEIHEEEEEMNSLASLIAQAERDIQNEQARIAEAKRKAEEERQRRLEEERNRQNEQQNDSNGNNDSGSGSTPISDNSPSLGSGVLATPMAPGTYRISSGFGYRIDPVYGTAGAFHSGTDFAAPRNTPIYAAEEGYVLFSGPANGYGNWIVIKHPNGLYTIYGHMYSDGLYVRSGEYVFRGQKIGGVGSAGKSTGNHLHFCVATSFSGGKFTYANPMNYIR